MVGGVAESAGNAEQKHESYALLQSNARRKTNNTKRLCTRSVFYNKSVHVQTAGDKQLGNAIQLPALQ